MKSVIIFLTCVVATCSSENYSPKFDAIDIDEILQSDRLIRHYVDCFMDRKGCTAQSAELKENLPDVLRTDCARCSENQKERAKKIVDFLFDKKPEVYKELESKYDVEEIYRKKLNGKRIS